jgi:hypothetical protein
MAEYPQARVYRPTTEKMNEIIAALMEARAARGVIPKPSWTEYIDYLLNKDIAEIQASLPQK